MYYADTTNKNIALSLCLVQHVSASFYHHHRVNFFKMYYADTTNKNIALFCVQCNMFRRVFITIIG